MATLIFKNHEEFKNRPNKSDNGVSPEFARLYPDYEKDNEYNEGCWSCRECKQCAYCVNCYNCWNLLNCEKCTNCTHSKYSNYCRDCSGCEACKLCINCRNCFGCDDCEEMINSNNCISCSNLYMCNYCKRCSNCSECNTCEKCKNCYACSKCVGCYLCSKISGSKNKSSIFDFGLGRRISAPEIPKIEKIHTKVRDAVNDTRYSLSMLTGWHNDTKIEDGAHCGTTHCRAGFVVFLAGKAGYELEKLTSTEFASKLIYEKSSNIPVSVQRYFENNEVALKDISRCAALEREQEEK